MPKDNRAIALNHAVNTAHLSGASSIIERADAFLKFLNAETVAEVEPGTGFVYMSRGYGALTYRYQAGAPDDARPEVWFSGEGWTESNTYDTVGEIRYHAEFTTTSNPEVD